MVLTTTRKNAASESVMNRITHRYLYYILTNELYVDNPCPIMIAVNKSDLPECADHKKVLQEASALLAGNEVGNAGTCDG